MKSVCIFALCTFSAISLTTSNRPFANDYTKSKERCRSALDREAVGDERLEAETRLDRRAEVGLGGQDVRVRQ